ncbi:MAG: DUF502 domain-containing protein [FCB group bacterium]|nr:DUF502 domain-containing protein [FCB group bacterium]
MIKSIIWQNFKNKILAGLFAVAPVALTFYILKGLFSFLDKLTAPLLKQFNVQIPGLGMILTLVLVYLLGLFVTNVLGRRLFSWGEKILTTIPLVNTIYNTIKQITQAFTGNTNRTFESVVYLEYPRKDLWTMAFVTGESKDQEDREYLHLFIPTTPNPTSGFFIMIPKGDAIPANIKVEDGLKAVISGGMLAPKLHNVGQIRENKP